MKILHTSTCDILGGAAIAAYRIHKGLMSIGEASELFCQFKASHDKEIIGPARKIEQLKGSLRFFLENQPLRFYPQRKVNMFSPCFLGHESFVKKISAINPDIVNMHLIDSGFASIEQIKAINKPLVWTLHTMSPFTGGCFYNNNCDLYKSRCQKCPLLGSTNQFDLSNTVFSRKRRAWKNINLTVVSPSSWLADCAKSSYLFKDKKITVIPNGLDTDIFKPLDKNFAREALSLPKDKKLILFGASDSLNDERKGFQFLLPALNRLFSDENSENTELVIFGANEPAQKPNLNIKVNYMGTLRDIYSMTLCYSAADVMIVPSTQEAFGQTASESLACGTPVVAFNVGGLPDIVDDRITGYLAEPFKSEALEAGIAWALEDENRHKNLRRQAREKALRCYDSKIVAKSYLNLYKEVLGR
ncbi:MAG TPA: glycosyltransferase family 4 protein [Candidatus Gastranaerophilales bacterium]|nr:glycosyltransferase family 4 protein [Candidatus Gastranaerophilales bacterium]